MENWTDWQKFRKHFTRDRVFPSSLEGTSPVIVRNEASPAANKKGFLLRTSITSAGFTWSKQDFFNDPFDQNNLVGLKEFCQEKDNWR